MKKRALLSLSKGIGYSTAVFFDQTIYGIGLSKIGKTSDFYPFDGLL
ncbi:hypothetical protein ACAF76_007400 [Brevibacillus sp. TJ4]